MIQSEIVAAKERIHRGHENIKEAKRLLCQELMEVTKSGSEYDLRCSTYVPRDTYYFYDQAYWVDEDAPPVITIKGGHDTKLWVEVDPDYCTLFKGWVENHPLWRFAQNEETVIMDLKDAIEEAENDFLRQEKMMRILEDSPQIDVPMPGED